MDPFNTTDLISIFENTNYEPLHAVDSDKSKFNEVIERYFTEFEKKLYQFFLKITETSQDDNDFDFDFIWPWLGYNNKESAKKVLFDNFVFGSQYGDHTTCCVPDVNTQRGGHNKYYFFISISTFKRLCLIRKTK